VRNHHRTHLSGLIRSIGGSRRLARGAATTSAEARRHYVRARLVRIAAAVSIIAAAGFNAVAVSQSSAISTGSLSTWLAMDGNIRYVPGATNQFGWGNEGTPPGGSCTNSGAIAVPGSHGLFNCGSPNGTQTPNPALNANGDSSILGRAFIPDPSGGGDPNSVGCTTGDATNINGGSLKYGTSATYATGNTPAPDNKNDLTDAYAVARKQQTPGGANTWDNHAGDTEVFFGVERYNNNGDVAADIEFSQAGDSWSGTCTSGTLSMPRSQGDIGIEFKFTIGGTIPVPVVDVWECDGTAAASVTVTAGTSCDPGNPAFPNAAYQSFNECAPPTTTTGCFPIGSVKLAENVGTTPYPGEIPCGGWVCSNTVDSAYPGANVDTNDFVEGGIDFSALAAVGLGASTCTSTIIAESHTSPSGSSDLKDFVGPGSFATCPSTTVTTPQAPSQTTLGNSWTDQAVVTGNPPTSTPPTGTVQFYTCGPFATQPTTNPACDPTKTGYAALGSPVTQTSTNGGSATYNSTSFTPKAVGWYCFAGVYSPGAGVNFSGSTDDSSGECFHVTAAPTTTTTTASGDVTLSPTGSATDSATVASSGGVPFASGDTVQFYECKVSSSVGQVGPCPNIVANKDGAAVAISGTPPQTVASPPVTPTSVGSYCFSAVFNGDGNDTNYGTSSDNISGDGVAAECFNVNPAHTTTTTTTSGDVTLSPTGSATDSATVASSGGVPFASGDTVQFYECKVSSSTGVVGPCAATLANKDGAAVSISGTPPQTVTSPPVTPTSVGSYCFSAVFNGDGNDTNYSSSSDNTTGNGVAAECFNVSPASTTTTTTTSGDVTLSPTGSATDSATVASSGGVPFASGDTVQFYECKVSSSTGVVGACAATLANKDGAAVSISGTPPQTVTSPPVTPTSVGSYCFSAVFNGDGNDTNYSSSSDNNTGQGVAAECFSVSPASTTTTTTTSGDVNLNPSGTATDSATVASSGGVSFASGDTVQFYECKVSSSTGVVGACAATLANKDGAAVSISGTPPQTVISPAVTPTAVGSYCFSAVFNGDGNDTNYLTSSDNTTGDGVAAECFSVTQPDFTVLKTDVPGTGLPVNPGATIPYTVLISNVGSGPGNATVTDNAPSNLTVTGSPLCGTLTGSDTCSVSGSGNDWTISVFLGKGDSVAVTFSGVVSSTDTTDVVNTAAITTGNCTANCSSTVTNPVPNIAVVKSVSPASGTAVFPGSTLTYTLTATNSGSGTGTDAITDGVPTNTTLVAGSVACGSPPSGASCSVTSSSGTPGWSVTLPADTSMTVTFQVKINATDTATITNFGTFTGPGCTSSSACSTNTVNNPVIVLTVVKSSQPASGSTVALGATVTYSLALSNAGSGAATDVTVSDTVPAGASYVTGSASCGGAPGCTASETGGAGGTVTWTGLTVAADTMNAVTLTFQVTINPTDTNGQVISNFGTFTNEGTPNCTTSTCNTNTVTLTVVVPATAPAASPPPAPIVAATTVHTGEPWAGSRLYELLAIALGLALIGIGEIERRRARRILARRRAD